MLRKRKHTCGHEFELAEARLACLEGERWVEIDVEKFAPNQVEDLTAKAIFLVPKVSPLPSARRGPFAWPVAWVVSYASTVRSTIGGGAAHRAMVFSLQCAGCPPEAPAGTAGTVGCHLVERAPWPATQPARFRPGLLLTPVIFDPGRLNRLAFGCLAAVHTHDPALTGYGVTGRRVRGDDCNERASGDGMPHHRVSLRCATNGRIKSTLKEDEERRQGPGYPERQHSTGEISRTCHDHEASLRRPVRHLRHRDTEHNRHTHISHDGIGDLVIVSFNPTSEWDDWCAKMKREEEEQRQKERESKRRRDELFAQGQGPLSRKEWKEQQGAVKVMALILVGR